MKHKDSINYLLNNCAFDLRNSVNLPIFNSVGEWGYFYRTLSVDNYNFTDKHWSQFPTNINVERKVVTNNKNKNQYKAVFHELEMMACSPDDFERDLRKVINSHNFLNELVNENLYLTIWYGWEGDDFTETLESEESFADKLNKIFKEYQIPRHKIIILVSNLIVEKLLSEKYNEPFYVWGDNWMEVDVFHRQEGNKRNLSITFDEHFKQLQYNYEKTWLRVNRTNNEDRDYLLFDIFKRNIEDNFLIDHRQFLLKDFMIKHEYGGSVGDITKRIKENIPFIASLEETNNVLTTDDWHDLSNEIIPNDVYIRAPFSFISTTFPHKKRTIFFHGSTFEPILNFHPFVLNSNKNFLQYLKESGYVTFDNVFDETYDTIEHDTERRIAAVDSVSNICNLQKNDVMNLILKCKERIQHNRNELIKCKSLINAHNRLAEHISYNG